MKTFVTTLLLTYIVAISYPQAASALSTDATIQILPLHCKFEIINDGTNEIRYITPGACGIKINTPTSNKNDKEPRANVPPVFPLWQNFRSSDDQIVSRKVFLNDIIGFLTSSGANVGMATNRVVHFVTFDGTEHSITINSVANDHVILTIASEPIQAKLYVGETKQFDPTNDGINDIEITVYAISSNLVDMSFRQVGASPTLNQKPAPGAVETAYAVQTARKNSVITIVTVLLLSVMVLYAAKRFKARH